MLELRSYTESDLRAAPLSENRACARESGITLELMVAEGVRSL